MPSASTNPVVLILNDENVIVSTLVAVLCRNGYNAVGFTTCAEGVHQCATVRPDLALIDIVVGGGNGIDAAMEIRKGVPRCHINYLDVWISRSRGNAGHTFEVLAKPILPNELLELLDRRLRHAAA